MRVLKPLSAGGFDPLSTVANDPGNENTGQARFVIDGDPATAWHTQYYLGNPRFGGLKSGTGLILDMGRPVGCRPSPSPSAPSPARTWPSR